MSVMSAVWQLPSRPLRGPRRRKAGRWRPQRSATTTCPKSPIRHRPDVSGNGIENDAIGMIAQCWASAIRYGASPLSFSPRRAAPTASRSGGPAANGAKTAGSSPIGPGGSRSRPGRRRRRSSGETVGRGPTWRGGRIATHHRGPVRAAGSVPVTRLRQGTYQTWAVDPLPSEELGDAVESGRV